ncbi:hypothetical protein HDU99_009626, partial [Rhizoclosmatium hyalinum]
MLEILRTLKKYGVGCVDVLDFDENAIDSDSSAIYNYDILSDIKIKKIEFVMYDSVTPFMRNLKHVVGLKEINIFFAKGKSFDFLFDCPALETIRFTDLDKDCAILLLECIMRSSNSNLSEIDFDVYR